MVKFKSIYYFCYKQIMTTIVQAREAISRQLDTPDFTAESVAIIEGIIQELESWRIEWEQDPELAGLHTRYLTRFEALDEEVRRNLSSIIERARARQDNLRAEISGIELPASVLGSEEIMRELQRLGIVRGNRAVFENSHVQERITRYLDYLNFISDVERDDREAITDPEGLVDRYRDLLTEETDWILDKRFLQYKYIEAIYADIIRRGYVLQKNATGEYSIVCPEIDEASWDLIYKNLETTHPNHPYLEVVSARNTRDLIDIAAVTHIMRTNSNLSARTDIIGQQTLIATILESHNIRSRSGATIQRADLLLLDWEYVEEQIDARLVSLIDPENGASLQAYNELMYVKNFIEHQEYDMPERNAHIFAAANTYRQWFMQEQALIDAFWGNIENVTPDSFVEVLRNMGWDFRAASLIFAVVAFLWWFRRLAVTAAGIGLATPFAINMYDTATASIADRNAIMDQLEIIRPHAVIPILANRTYQEQFERIAEINQTNLNTTVDEHGRTLPFVANNFIIAKILNEVHASGQDFDLNSPTVVTDIYTAMRSKDITNTEFPHFRGTNYTITREDVQSFILLTESEGFRETWDETLSDVFSRGIDIRNQSYESFDFTVDANFDRALNNHLRTRWLANTTTEGRESIRTLQETIEARVSAGITDNFFDSITGRNTADVIRTLPERLGNLDDLIAEISSMTHLQAPTKDPLINPTTGILPKYKIFLEADAEMSNYDGTLANGTRFITDTWGDMETFVGGLAGRTGISELETEKSEIDAVIARIEPTTFFVNGVRINLTTDPLYASLVSRANVIKSELEERSQALQEEIDRRNEELRRQAFGIPNIAEINNLSLDESESAYREAVVRINTSIGEFTTMVRDFQVHRDIQRAFTSGNIEQYRLLQAALDELQWMTLTGSATFPSKLWLRGQVQAVFASGGPAEIFESTAEAAFTQYFENLNTIQTSVSGTTTSFTDISTLLATRDELADNERDLKQSIGYTESIYAFVRQSETRANQEIAYATAQELFGASFSVAHDTLSARNTIDGIIEKREEVAEWVQNYINSLVPTGTPPTYDFSVLENLRDMDSRGVIAFARESELGFQDNIPTITSQVEIDYANKVEEVALSIIETVPATPAGITLLRQIDTELWFNANQGLWERVKRILGWVDQVELNFDAKVWVVWASILSWFSEDLNGLNDIIDFRNSGTDYNWINDRTTNFDTRYNTRLEQIRNTVKARTIVNTIPSLRTAITTLVGSYGRLDPRISLEDFETDGTKTIAQLIRLLGLTDTRPSGVHWDFQESDRITIYEELERLHILW